MEIRIKNAAGGVTLLLALPAIAQDSVTAKASAVTGCASCPPHTSIVNTPGDPTWFVAGLVTGLVIGFVAAKVLGGKKQQ